MFVVIMLYHRRYVLSIHFHELFDIFFMYLLLRVKKEPSAEG